MGVRMEKSVVHDLLDVVVDKLSADLSQVIPFRLKTCSVIHRAAAYILHYKNP